MLVSRKRQSLCIVKLRDYFGVVVLKEARKNEAHGTPRTGALIINRLIPEADVVRANAVQEVFSLRVAGSFAKVRSNFSTWVYAVVRNVIVDTIRMEQKLRIAATPSRSKHGEERPRRQDDEEYSRGSYDRRP